MRGISCSLEKREPIRNINVPIRNVNVPIRLRMPWSGNGSVLND